MPILKDGSIVVNNWQKGIAPSSLLGFEDVRNVDTDFLSGILRLAKAANKVSGTTIDGVPRYVAVDNGRNVYILCTNGKLYSAAPNGYGTWTADTGHTATTGRGLLFFRDALLLIANDGIHMKSNMSGGGTWENSGGIVSGWTLDSADYHTPIVGQDDIAYIANGYKVASLTPAAAGDLTTSATFNANALDLPEHYKIKTLEELGTDLMIGTFVGSSSGLLPIGDVFPWDRSGSSSFGLPIRTGDNGINFLKTVNNILYIQAGQLGNWYVSNGSSSRFLFRMPDIRFTLGDPQPQAIGYKLGRIYCGIRATGYTDSNIGKSGVYSFNLDGSGLRMENTISTGISDSNVTIGFLQLLRDNVQEFLIGFDDTTSSSKGVDEVDAGANNFVGSYGGYVDSEMFSISDTIGKKPFEAAEIYLDKALAANEGVRLAYRLNRGDSFTTIDTIDYATYGAIRSFSVPFGLSEVEQIQFRISLTGTTTTPHLKYARFL